MININNELVRYTITRTDYNMFSKDNDVTFITYYITHSGKLYRLEYGINCIFYKESVTIGWEPKYLADFSSIVTEYDKY